MAPAGRTALTFGKCVIDRRGRTYCQQDGTPQLSGEIKFCAIVSHGDGLTWQCPPSVVQVCSLSPLDYSVRGRINGSSESEMRC